MLTKERDYFKIRALMNTNSDAEKIEQLLRVLAYTIKRKGRSALKDFGITTPQFDLMVKIYFNGDMTQGKLTQELHLAKSTVSGLLDRLESKNFIKREKDMNDKRNVIISLTNKGNAVIERVIEERVKFLRKLIKDFDEKEVHTLINSLEKLVEASENLTK